MGATELRNYLETKGKIGQKPVTLFLMNGFQMRGVIKEVYDGWLVLEDRNDQQEKDVFLHAISTISPF